jgi:cytochrome c oxidase subunit 2
VQLKFLFPLSRPVDVSLDGYRGDTLFYVTTVMCGALFVIMTVILLWACLRHKQGRYQARYETGVGLRPLVGTAVITALIAICVDGTLLIDSYIELDRALWRFPTAAQHPLEIEIYAQQWSWNVRYPGPDGVFGTPDDIVLLDELHVPRGRPVVVKMRSKDVVHSFYLPNLRVKQDVLPGVITRTWFQATRAGAFELGCAQHCGVSHYRMRGILTVDEPDAFRSWEQAAAADAARRYDSADADAHWGWPWES